MKVVNFVITPKRRKKLLFVLLIRELVQKLEVDDISFRTTKILRGENSRVNFSKHENLKSIFRYCHFSLLVYMVFRKFTRTMFPQNQIYEHPNNQQDIIRFTMTIRVKIHMDVLGICQSNGQLIHPVYHKPSHTNWCLHASFSSKTFSNDKVHCAIILSKAKNQLNTIM